MKRQTKLHLVLSPSQAKKLQLNLDGTPIINTANNKQLNEIVDEKQKFRKIPEIKKIEKKKEDKELTIFEEAQKFAGRIAAILDGFSPFAGVVIVVIPFMLSGWVVQAELLNFIFSFILTIFVLFLLGTYLAKLSNESILKYGSQMVIAALLTGILTLGLSQLVSNI